ncbi:MAG: calcium/sodium antiporter [Alphaproteobacteria bacterium]
MEALSLSLYNASILSMGALFFGIVMIIKGGNWAIDAAVYVAERYGISPMVVGFTIIAFGTSLPELVVSVVANFQDSPGIALGNVVGSNIANILLVLGVASLFVTLKATVSEELVRDLLFMLLATASLAGMLVYGEITRMMGLFMLIVLGVYVYVQFSTSQEDDFVLQDPEEDRPFENSYVAYFVLFIGLVCIAVGAEFLVKGAQFSAKLAGVPESVIALSIVAFGTSLPELSTSIIAARKNQSGMLIGNIIGSNVFNILLILAAAALSRPMLQGSFSGQMVTFDIWVALLVAIVCSAVLFFKGRISRLTGGMFFLSYIGYNVVIYMMGLSS